MSAGRARSVLAGVSLVRRAGGAAFPAVMVLFAVSSVGVVVELLIGNAMLHEILRHGDSGGASTRIWVLLLVVVVVAGIVAFATAAATGMHRLLAERCIRYCAEAVLQVAARVPLREFDDPSSTTASTGPVAIR